METELRRWCVGAPGQAGAGTVACTAAELAAAPGRVVAFHRAMAGAVSPATEQVDVHLPTYRGKNFVPVLAWLIATKLSRPGTGVVWHLDKQQGPDSVRRLLGSLGWRLDQSRQGRSRLLTGYPPATAELPQPREFTAEIGRSTLRMAADYGVFSPGEVDAGTELLLRVALHGPAVDVLADIGTGYGPLAIALVRNDIADRAVATDVDAIALWLAGHNARANGVPLDAMCSADPTEIQPTPLTVCNVPTHINAGQTAALMDALLRRARDGRLLTVVHASLEARYTRYFTQAGLSPVRHPGPAHVVLDSGT